LWANLAVSLRDSLWASLRAGLWDGLWGCLEESLRNSPDNGLGDSLRASLQASPETRLPAAGGEGEAAALLSPIDTPWWGAGEAYWVAYYRFAAEVLGVTYAPDAAEGLALLDALVQSCGWWYPRDGLIVACERPAVVQMEEHPDRPGTYRLHASDGPAVQFRDGWSVYAWHGVVVPPVVIEAPSQITREQFTRERDVEVRRAMWERLGPDRVIALLDVEPVHTDAWNGQTYTLYRTREPDELAGDYLQFVRVTCPSTGRVYHLSVPPTVTTAREAVAWTFGHTAATYHPDVEQ
jgi:hypothetical protein